VRDEALLACLKASAFLGKPISRGSGP